MLYAPGPCVSMSDGRSYRVRSKYQAHNLQLQLYIQVWQVIGAKLPSCSFDYNLAIAHEVSKVTYGSMEPHTLISAWGSVG